MTERVAGGVRKIAWGSYLRNYGLWIVAVVVVFALPHVFDSRANQSMFGQMGVFVIFALSYSGRAEIVDAANSLNASFQEQRQLLIDRVAEHRLDNP